MKDLPDACNICGARWSCEHGDVFHVLPVSDLREHVESLSCWCSPDLELESHGAIITHHSMDGRELIEKHGVN